MPTNATTIVRASLLLLAGGFAAQHSRVALSADQCLWFFVCALGLCAFRCGRGLAVFILGFALFMQAGLRTIDARVSEKFAGDSMLVQVRIADFPKRVGPSTTLLLETVSDPRVPVHSRVTWFDPPQLPKLGEVWQLELRLRRPRGHSNPGVFSVENWMFRENVLASGYVVPGKRNRLLMPADLNPLKSVRRDFVNLTTQHGGGAAPVLAAISVGARHLISREQWTRYAATGTSHLMAISGLHIGLAAASVFALVAYGAGLFRLRGNNLDKGIVAGVLIAGGYALISGFLVPSQRASIMLALVALAFVLRRRTDPFRIVALTAMLVFVADPVSLMKPGFCLSFAAVLLLLWFSATYRRPLRWSGHLSSLLGSFLQLVNMQVVLLFGLMPLTLLFFQRVALLAPAANLLCVPIFSFVTVPATLLGLMLFQNFETASVLLLQFAAVSVAVIEKMLMAFSTSALADIPVSLANLNLGIILLPALWVVLPKAWPGRRLGLLAVLAIFLHEPTTPGNGCFNLHVLDVGQGLAVVVQSKDRTLVFDTGASYRGGGSAAAQVLLPFLQYRGIHSIDWLVVSHSDDDHAGGVAALKQQLPIQQSYVGEKNTSGLAHARPCNAGGSWSEDGISYRFLHPMADTSRDGNNASCVLSVSSGDFRVLLTGDIEAEAEHQLLAQTDIRPVRVVVIPHHGSLTSSTPAFVSRLRPDLAIASAGFGNRWGFPKDRVKRRWEGIGATVLDTSRDGAVSLQGCARDGIRWLRQERQASRRFWHDSATQ